MVCITWNCRVKLKPYCLHVVRIINPQRKSDYNTRIWHNVHEKFTSPEALKEKLMDTLKNLEIPSSGLKLQRTCKQCTIAIIVMTPTPCGVMVVKKAATAKGQNAGIPVILILLSLPPSEQGRRNRDNLSYTI